MANLFNTLGVGYSGLAAAQVGVNVTGHNIANAETEGYTRQRVVQSAATPIQTNPGAVGNGVEIQDIKRVFDNFVFDRYTAVSSDKEYSDFYKSTMEELSNYFPEIDGVGLKADLAAYYDMWQTFSDNPENDAVKIALAKQTETLTSHIQQVQGQVYSLQKQVNEQLSVNIKQVNEIAQQIADLNKSIDVSESGDLYEASDLRDKRNLLEKNLAQLIGADVNQGQLKANIQIDSNSNTRTGSYTISVNGFNIVDGTSVHPLRLESENSQDGFYSVSYERQDATLIPLEEEITGGKIGAIFDLRGRTVDDTSGVPTDGVLQTVVAQIDALANGLIETTNNLYAKSATTQMRSNNISLSDGQTLHASGLNINEGSFDVVIYDIDGNEIARRTVDINAGTTMNGAAGSNSIEAQIKANHDDNGDLSGGNDVDDFLQYNFQVSADGQQNLELVLDAVSKANGYTFSIEDNLKTESFSSGTNFAGSLGLSRFFDGNNAKNIELNASIQNNPTTLKGGYSSANGDNRVALDMLQQQFENYDFKVGQDSYNTTVYDMFDTTATYVGITTNTAITQNETMTTRFNSTQLEYDSISKVSIDEEMTNLIKYQTSYGAASKVITTVDQMMQTLLGIKQ